jgi:hypothetical protein
MTQQPEFTPRRGSVSSHYEAPKAPRGTSEPQPPDDPTGIGPSFAGWVAIVIIVILGIVALLYSAVQ